MITNTFKQIWRFMWRYIPDNIQTKDFHILISALNQLIKLMIINVNKYDINELMLKIHNSIPKALEQCLFCKSPSMHSISRKMWTFFKCRPANFLQLCQELPASINLHSHGKWREDHDSAKNQKGKNIWFRVTNSWVHVLYYGVKFPKYTADVLQETFAIYPADVLQEKFAIYQPP